MTTTLLFCRSASVPKVALISFWLVVLVTITLNSSSKKQMVVEAYGTKTVVVGLNAAFQKRFVLPSGTSLEPGSVHRAASLEEGIGGKGQDVAIALGCLSSSSSSSSDVLLAQFLGKGAEGDQVCSMLHQRLGKGDDPLTVRSEAKLRTCTTIVASDVATELVEPSGIITSDEIEDLLHRISNLDKNNNNDDIGGLCIMGSMPPGCPEDMYASIHQSLFSNTAASQQQPLCLVDSVVGLKPLLQQMSSHRRSISSLSCRGGMFKVNIAELCKLANVQKTSGGEANCATKDEIINAVGGFLQLYDDAKDALEYIAITDGKYPAHLVKLNIPIDDDDDSDTSSFQVWQLEIPNLEMNDDKPLYPIGAGDTVAAGTLAAWQYMSLLLQEEKARNKDFTLLQESIQQKLIHWNKNDSLEPKDQAAVTSFAFGLACGSASCLQQENSVLEVQDALSLLEQMNPPKSIS